ncbi:MAG: HEAT repeat domain-containing protein [Acidimicrobiales bacterium]
MQWAALHHGDPWVRRSCLGFLDHHAADGSGPIFMAALDDPVAPVRDLAMHGLACERCRTEDLCVTDVTPKITRILDCDPNAEIRFKALSILRRLADRDPAAIAAMHRAAERDLDDRVREAAAAILAGGRPRRWNQFRRSFESRKGKATRR